MGSGGRRRVGESGAGKIVNTAAYAQASRFKYGEGIFVEDAERLVHGLSLALQKRGLPHALMTDRGSAETAAELTEGLLRLGREVSGGRRELAPALGRDHSVFRVLTRGSQDLLHDRCDRVAA